MFGFPRSPQFPYGVPQRRPSPPAFTQPFAQPYAQPLAQPFAQPLAQPFAPPFAQSFAQASFAKPTFAQPPFAQPAFAQPAFAQPAFAQSPFAQPPFALTPFAKPSFAQPPFAQLPMRQSIFQPQYKLPQIYQPQFYQPPMNRGARLPTQFAPPQFAPPQFASPQFAPTQLVPPQCVPPFATKQFSPARQFVSPQFAQPQFAPPQFAPNTLSVAHPPIQPMFVGQQPQFLSRQVIQSPQRNSHVMQPYFSPQPQTMRRTQFSPPRQLYSPQGQIYNPPLLVGGQQQFQPMVRPNQAPLQAKPSPPKPVTTKPNRPANSEQMKDDLNQRFEEAIKRTQMIVKKFDTQVRESNRSHELKKKRATKSDNKVMKSSIRKMMQQVQTKQQQMKELALQYEDGYIYRGQGLAPQTRQGYGTLTDADDQEIYKGFWRNNVYHGDGRLINTSLKTSDTLVDFNNLRDIDNIWSSYQGTTNFICQGEFQEGKMHGLGILTMGTGEKFTGTFVQGMIDGPGQYEGNDEIIEGEWRDGIYVEQ